MTITDFTPATGFAGGLLIGLSATLLLAGSGRIAGISGVLGGALGSAPTGDRAWRWLFLCGLVIGGLLYLLLQGGSATAQSPSTARPLVLLGALLVGFGTRMGNGCTSGHGVCGLARLSFRSLVATVMFMAAGFATIFVLRHLLG